MKKLSRAVKIFFGSYSKVLSHSSRQKLSHVNGKKMVVPNKFSCLASKIIDVRN